MKTIILPGYSLHNQEWAEEVARKIGARVHYWLHWQPGASQSLNLRKEIARILELMKNEERISLIAKSVGVMVVVHLLPKISGKVEKIILCGIPSVSEERLKLFQEALKNFSPEKIVVFQNSQDPFATFVEVKEFMEKINRQIKVIEKPAATHDYPYFPEFERFLV